MTDSPDTRRAISREELLAQLALIEPPPIEVVHRGWLRTTVTQQSLAELERENALLEQAKRTY